MPNPRNDLLELAEGHFGELTEPERLMFRAAENAKALEPANTESTAGKIAIPCIRADRLAWLCRHPRAREIIRGYGIRIKGCRIKGKLNLQYVECPFPLHLDSCEISEGIDLHSATLHALFLPGTKTGPIIADRLQIRDSVFLNRGFVALGGVLLRGATIGDTLDCTEAHFLNPGGDALNACGATIRGALLLRFGFMSEGEINLQYSTIGGCLECDGAILRNEGGRALYCDSMTVTGDVLLRHRDTHNDEPFVADGEVSFLGAKIGGTFNCSGGQFRNKGGFALRMTGLTARLACLLNDGFRAVGEVTLAGASIGRDLSCNDGLFEGFERPALDLTNTIVGGNADFRSEFKAVGMVLLSSGRINSNLQIQNAEFCATNDCAIQAQALQVDGSVIFQEPVRVIGNVDFSWAQVRGSLHWIGISMSATSMLDLRFTRVQTYADQASSWPQQDKLHLAGFEFDQLDDDAAHDATTRLRWLQLQPTFQPQPYEQIASVLRRAGYESDARKILIAKEIAITERVPKFSMRRAWRWTLEKTVEYGYSLQRAVCFATCIVLISGIFFSVGYSSGLFASTRTGGLVTPVADTEPTVEPFRSHFNPMVYSLDAFLPVVNLYQADDWSPDAHRGPVISTFGGWQLKWGGVLLFWLWFHILSGWALTTLLVVGLTRAIRS